MKITFRGDARRVQITVYDFDGDRATKFAVYTLPVHCNKNIAFRTGCQEYLGGSYAKAMGVVFRYFQGPFPESLTRYSNVEE